MTIANNLAEQTCELCSSETSPVTDDETTQLLKEIPDWYIETRNDQAQLERRYEFQNFVDALAFANKVGELAEQANHHPAILVEWGKVTVTWWTHDIGGLHRNDFILAARTDLLL